MRHGFLLIDKPVGPTSHDGVAIVRRTLGERSIGHLGTLDPAASGLLVLAVGSKALKVVELFKDLPKEYEADVRFGSISTTYDREGVIEELAPKPGWEPPNHLKLRTLLEDRFIGKTTQIPPAFSAVHVNGQRSHVLARKGEEVSIPARVVEVRRCDIVSYEYPDLRLSIACSSGTYIRSLAHDLGQLLYFGSYLSGLKRTKVGEWSVADAVAPDEAKWVHVRPLREVLQGFPSVEITEQEATDLRHGRNIHKEVTDGTFAWHEGLPIAILVPAKDGSRMAHPKKVL